MKSTHINQPGLIFTPGAEGWWDSERVCSRRVIHSPMVLIFVSGYRWGE